MINAVASSSTLARAAARTASRLRIARVCSAAAATPPIPRRQLHSSAMAWRDLGAKYRRPLSVETSDERVVRKSEIGAVQPSPDPHAGRRNKFVTVEGVRIPPKPIPPGDQDCCMSGCVHCVLTLYADDVLEYNGAMEEAQGKLEARGVPRAKWPEVMNEGDEAGGEDEPKVELDPTMSAFMALEAKLNKKHHDQTAKTFTAKRADPLLATFGGPSVTGKQRQSV